VEHETLMKNNNVSATRTLS